MNSELRTPALLEPPIEWKVLLIGLRNIKLKDRLILVFRYFL